MIYWPIGPFGRPALVLRGMTGGGGGGETSERLRWVLGLSGVMSKNRDGGPWQVHGEVAVGYESVILICSDGSQAHATILDCVKHISFNVYVAEVQPYPVRVVASNDLGHAFSKMINQPSFWAHETPEAAAVEGWPEGSRVEVASVEVRGDRAEVVLDSDPRWPNRVYCVRTRGRWHEAISANGPISEWDDPWQDPMSSLP